jgi:hypothetical protein
VKWLTFREENSRQSRFVIILKGRDLRPFLLYTPQDKSSKVIDLIEPDNF